MLMKLYKNNILMFFKTCWGVLEVLFFTTLPTITLFFYAILSNNKESCYFLSNEANANGEFLLYSLALLSSAYTTSKYYKGGARISCIIILLIVTSVLYTLITVLRENNSNLINYTYLSIISLILFTIAIIYTYPTVRKQVEQSVDAKETNDKAIKDIEDKIQF